MPELARYFNGVKIAAPIVEGRLAVYPIFVDNVPLLHGVHYGVQTDRNPQPDQPKVIWPRQESDNTPEIIQSRFNDGRR